MKRIFSASLIWLLCSQAYTKSLGVVGEVFPVSEQSFLHFIQDRLQKLSQEGQLDAINARWKHGVEEHANRPRPLHLPHATIKRVYAYVPEIVTDFDIKDATGHVIYPRGTVANALSQLPYYTPCWLFLNADEKSELQWAIKAMKTCSSPKVILTGGAIHDAEVALNTVIYFDQNAVLTQKLGIQATPARVTRQGNELQIEELVIKENGDVF